jgi:hypothetical protein
MNNALVKVNAEDALLQKKAEGSERGWRFMKIFLNCDKNNEF